MRALPPRRDPPHPRIAAGIQMVRAGVADEPDHRLEAHEAGVTGVPASRTGK